MISAIRGSSMSTEIDPRPHAQMRERGRGRIVSISSMSGDRATSASNYAAAKAGLIGLTKIIALELAQKGITANCIAPGFVLADMTAVIPAAVLEQERQKIPLGTCANLKTCRYGGTWQVTAPSSSPARDQTEWSSQQVGGL
jgi:NAD(P)-dependent dehydrogenase (short-subunit alcohol dehydrogenase family)